MTHSFIEGYFGNLYINVDLIILVYYFSQHMKLALYYCLYRYKYTYMFKTLCKLDHTRGTHIWVTFIFGQTNQTLLFVSYVTWPATRGLPILSFSFFSFLFLSFISSSPFLSTFYYFSSRRIKEELEDFHFSSRVET